MHKVYGFFNDFRWLSNFYISNVILDGETYPTVEHAYQAAKTNDPEIRKQIREALTPKVAKRFGTQLVKMTESDKKYWDAKKYWIMMGLIRQKFHNYKELQEKLVATGDAELVEANWWGDIYWGVCNDQGENNLGKILMKVREEFSNVKVA